MRLIGIIGERWCSSSRASCSVATPGGRSRSSCRNAIRAGCSTTPSIRSRAVSARCCRRRRRRSRRLLTRRTAGTARGASLARFLHRRRGLLVRRRASRRGPCGSQRVEADEKLASWIEAMPIEDIVALWERQPLFADQSDAARRGAAAGPPVAGPALARPPAAHRRPGHARPGLARAAHARPSRCSRSRAPATTATARRRSGSPRRRRTPAPRSWRRRATRRSCSSPRRWRS